MNNSIKYKSVTESIFIIINVFLVAATILNQVNGFFCVTQLYSLSFLHVNISVSVNELYIKDTRSLVQVSFFHADPLSLATVTMTTGQELKWAGRIRCRWEKNTKDCKDRTMAERERETASTCFDWESTCKRAACSETWFISTVQSPASDRKIQVMPLIFMWLMIQQSFY